MPNYQETIREGSFLMAREGVMEVGVGLGVRVGLPRSRLDYGYRFNYEFDI